MALLPGYRIWEYNPAAPLLVANSPLLSPWFDTTGYTTVMPVFKFTSGTTVNSIVASFDGINTDNDLTALWATPATGVALVVMSPFFQWKTVQSIADTTVSKVFLQA